MAYRAPLDDILFAMRRAAGEAAFAPGGLYEDCDEQTARATLEEVAKFAEGVLLPLDRVGDREGLRFAADSVTTAPGWRDAYRQWIEGGWNALAAGPDHGGMGLPLLLAAACTEIWNAANISFALCPLLGQGAIEAMEAHASEALKAAYLPKMISGEWTATMNLTEPQAGSDLAQLRTRAERAGDGSYRLFGQKIFITYGEHDLSANIVHFVLARLPDAPAGTRGISLFLAPKFLPDAAGAPGERNDLRCAGLERKLGIHAAPTCTMAYGDHGGAVAFLVGEENAGLACMFTMMNNARLSVGLQGVALAERATQTALAYARERLQGRAPNGPEPSPIVAHPDVARMLLTMKAQTAAARAICFLTAASLDRARRQAGEAAREAEERAGLLTPLAKAYSTDVGVEAASLGIQVHGGMGFIEETGAAQLLRDARITPIYEGTNGIQAIDLVTRKLRLSGGAAVAREIADMRADVDSLSSAGAIFARIADRAGAAVAAFERATAHLLALAEPRGVAALSAATPYLKLFGLARGATLLGAAALAAHRGGGAAAEERIVLARFFGDDLAVGAEGLERAVVAGGDVIADASRLLARNE